MRKNIFIEIPYNKRLSRDLLIENTIKSSQEFFKEYLHEKYDLFIVYWFEIDRGTSKIVDYKKLWKYLKSNTKVDLDIGVCSEDMKYKYSNGSNYYGVQKVNITHLEQLFVNNMIFNSIIIYSNTDYLNNPRQLEPILNKYLQKFKSFNGIPENNKLVKKFLNNGDIIVQLRRSDDCPCVHVAMN